jgi:purine-binding chemotaxis protein CheW
MQNDNDSTQAGEPGNGGYRKFLTFLLGQEVYAVDILRVKEIRGWSPVTRIPQSAESLLGVLNLRGAVVPVIDLRLRFALQAVEFKATTVIIVLSLRSGSGQREFGIVVDSVQDVVDVEAATIKPAPAMSAAASSFIEGIATHEQQMLILLDAECLARGDESTTSPANQAA